MSERIWRLSLMAIPLLFLLLYFSFYENLSIHAQLEDSNRREVLQAVTGRVQGYLDELIVTSRAFASLDAIRDMEQPAMHRQLITLARAFPQISNVAVFDRNGVLVDCLIGHCGGSAPDAESFKKTLAGQTVIANYEKGYLLAQPLIYAQSPIFTPDERIAGAVAVFVNTYDLTTDLSDLALEKSQVLLVDDGDKLIYQSGEPLAPAVEERILRQASLLPPYRGYDTFIDGHAYNISVVPVKNTPWRLVLLRHASTIQALAMNVIVRNSILIFFAFLIALGMYKYYLIRHQHFLNVARAREETLAREFIDDILNSTPLAIINVNNEMRLTYANRTWEEFTGYKQHEVLGLTLLQTYALLRLKPAPGHGGEPRPDDPLAYWQVSFRRRDGETINAMQYTCPFMRGNSREGTLIFYRDISTLIKYHTLKQTADAVLQQMLGGVLVVDETGCVTMLNSAGERIIAQPAEKVLGRHVGEVLAQPDGEQPITLQALETMQGAGPVEKKYLFAGREYWLLVSADVLRDTLGNFAGVVTVFNDITELHKQQELNQQREKLAMVGQMAAGMAHELRNPLTSVKGFAQLLAARLKDGRNREYLEIMIREIDRTNEIIKDFLLLARPRKPRGEPLDINDLVKQLLMLVESQCILMQVDLRQELAPDLPPINAEANQLKQVFLNFTHNALQAMESSPQKVLTLSTRREGDYVVVSVRDTGHGMSAETLSRLGTPFFTTKETGTGLGLTVSYRIIEYHGGRVEVSSRPEQGTEFRVYLPAMVKREAAGTASPPF